MRVLHLPENIASQIQVSVRALRKAGVEARGLVLNPKSIQSSEGLEILITAGSKRRKLAAIPTVFAAIHWADVLHWHYGATALPYQLDYHWARLLKKPGIVQFWGSDIRIAEVESRDNPIYAEARRQGHFHLPDRADESLARQQRFAAAGYTCIIADRILLQYVQHDLFSQVFVVPQLVDLADYEPGFPAAAVERPVIAHSPSRPAEKGTPAVLAAIEALQSRCAFDFRLITGVERRRALQMMREADIFIDQLIAGAHGLAALEAMALGKPVVCYIKPSNAQRYPPDLPVVNATAESLVEVLGGLLANGARRNRLGRRGRAYVEKYHAADQVAQQLNGIYLGLLEGKRGQLGRR